MVIRLIIWGYFVVYSLVIVFFMDRFIICKGLFDIFNFLIICKILKIVVS